MGVFVMGADVLKRAREITAFASQPENRYVIGKSDWVPGDRPEFVLSSGTVRAVFSITEDEEGRVFRHMSVSVRGAGERYPDPVIVYTVANLFGFTGCTTNARPGSDLMTAPGPDWSIYTNRSEGAVVVIQQVEPKS